MTGLKHREEGDTLIYNVASFTDKQDKTIGDVMRKMPEVEVTQSGKITYNGTSINKFYIEGKDLPEGKYGIATNGISPDDVGSVEITEGHQPIHVLQGISLSTQAAVNLRLKNNAKTQWITNVLSMGGVLGMWPLHKQLQLTDLFECQSCNFHNIFYRKSFFFHSPGISKNTFFNALFTAFRTTFRTTFQSSFYLSLQLSRIKNIILDHQSTKMFIIGMAFLRRH